MMLLPFYIFCVISKRFLTFCVWNIFLPIACTGFYGLLFKKNEYKWISGRNLKTFYAKWYIKKWEFHQLMLRLTKRQRLTGPERWQCSSLKLTPVTSRSPPQCLNGIHTDDLPSSSFSWNLPALSFVLSNTLVKWEADQMNVVVEVEGHTDRHRILVKYLDYI